MNVSVKQATLPKDSYKEMLETLCQWVVINSHSANLEGLSKMLNALEEAFTPLQGMCRRVKLPKRQVIGLDGQVQALTVADALHITKRPEAPFQVLLGGHYDTVFSEHSPFQKITQKTSSQLSGPGVADMKGGIAILLYALKQLESSPLAKKIGWHVLLTPDEEIGSPSSGTLYLQAAKEVDVGLIFEPAFPDGKLASSRKGSSNYLILAKGKSAHVGRNFQEGRSAIAALAHFIAGAHSLNHLFEGVTVNIGQVRGGEANNVVPPFASCEINVRASEEKSLRLVQDALYALAAEAAKKMVVHHEGISLKIHELTRRNPKPFDKNTQKLFCLAKECASRLGIKLAWQETGGVCDGNILASTGLPTIDTLGAVGGNLHTHYEYIETDSLIERTRLTTLLLLNLASQQPIQISTRRK